MADKNTQIVRKIIGHAEKILSYCQGVGKSGFTSDSKLVEACAFNLLQIGELSRLLEEDYTTAHSDIPWHKIRGLRNRIVHDYEGIDLSLIWDIIDGDLRNLKHQLDALCDDDLLANERQVK
jgi:uncharacterized protein with HEPN domain